MVLPSPFPQWHRCGTSDGTCGRDVYRGATKLELRARCLIDDPCSFAGETIRVELELINVGDKDIALPVEYFRRQGPQVILVDNHSSKEKRLGTGPSRSYLFD